MKIDFSYFSHPGRKGPNEDCVLPPFNVNDTWWAAIADGMGGHPGGEIASSTAIEAISTAIKSEHITDVAKLFASAQDELRKLASVNPNLSSMGTTLSLIRFSDSNAEVGHVGDTRIYHLRSEGILDRTVDQTEVEQLVQQGVLSRASAHRYPRRHILLSVLSPDRKYEIYRSKFDLRQGDRLILLTDGVCSKFMRKEIRDLSIKQTTAQSFCEALASEIVTRHPEDDYSAICIDLCHYA